MQTRTVQAAAAFFAILMLVASAARSAETPERPDVWTARQAVIYALQHNPDSKIAAQRIAVAEASLQQAESAFRPRANLTAMYSQTNTPMYSFGNILNQGAFSNDIDFNNPGRTDDLNLKAELLYRFYNGGRDTAGRNGAESALQASQTGRSAVEHQLGLAVVQAFQAIIQAQDHVEARQAELDAIEASLEVAAARYNAGDLLKTDLLNIEVQKASASENLIISRNQLELSRKIFLNLLGLTEGTVSINPPSEDEQPLPQPENYLQRPVLASLEARVAAAESELARADGMRYPTVDGFASYQYDQGWVNDGDGDSWSAGLKVNYSLYSGGERNAEIARKKAEYEEASQQLAKQRLAVNLELQQAELNYQEAVERRSVTDKMVQVARESAQLNRERFKEGVILSSDLIDTEVRLTDALVRQSAAHANYQIAIARVRWAAGMQQFASTTEELLENQP